LDKIPPEAKNRAEAIIVRGRVLIHKARQLKNDPAETAEDQCKARQEYQAAIKALRHAQGRDTLSNKANRKAMYLIGVCFLELGDYRAALAQLARTRKLFADSPEALAADLEVAELSRQLGRDSDALAGYLRVLKAITDPANFSNPWITLDQLRKRMQAAYRDYLETRKFEIGLQLVRHFYPLFSRVQSLQLAAETHRRWGESLLAEAEHLTSDAAAVRRQGRGQLRLAGRSYARLAQRRIATRHYPDDLWQSATSYLRGQDYQSTVQVLGQYLKNESRRRHPLALVNLGEAMLALGENDKALAAFRECIDYHPRDAAAFRARLLTSRACVEKGDLKQAENLLLENLNGDFLTPASKEWRDSLFDLGHLLYINGRYEKAIGRLEEAIQRYPESPRALESRYLIANCYCKRAKRVEKAFEEDRGADVRATHRRQVTRFLEAALDNYRKVQETLSRRLDHDELALLEESILRNCHFSIGDILIDLAQYDAAITAYSTVVNRYQNAPEVLEAYLQLAEAYRHSGQPDQARGTLEQAKLVLARMKPEAPFQENTNYTRKQWAELLTQLSSL